MINSTTKVTYKRILRTVAVAAFWLAVWYLIAKQVGQELILPGPVSVFSTFIRLCGEKLFWQAVGNSILSMLAGFAAGVAAGTVFAALTSWSRLADAVLSPVLRLVRAMPVASFIVLAMLWIGRVKVPAFSCMLMVIPVIWSSVSSAISGTDRDLLEMAKIYRFGRFQTLRLIYIPTAAPAWSAACVTAIGLAWKAAVAAEVLSLPKISLGAQVYYSKIYLETPSLFAWTAAVIMLSFLLEKCFILLLKRGKKV